MKAYILLRSGISPHTFYRAHYLRTREEEDVIICADGGYRLAQDMGLRPDFTIGDLDSLNGNVQVGEVSRYPTKKDFSDFELALQKAEKLGPELVVVYGALGGRKDHEITNIVLLAFAKLPVVFIEEEVEIFNVIRSLSLHGRKNSICSLVAFGGPCEVHETRGFFYSLRQEVLLPSSRGLSNIVREEEAHISIGKGNLIVVVTGR
jgi:thiamine pyrophosphokinase